MGLFSRQVAKSAPSHAVQQRINCPAIADLLGSFSLDKKYRIFYLGRACNGNVGFFSELRCKIYFGSVISALMDFQKPLTEDDTPQLKLEKMLDLDDLGNFDLIILHDLLNYLDQRLIPQMAESLRELMPRDAYLHAFIYTQQEMPAQPGCWCFDGTDAMKADYADDRQAPAVRFAQRELERLMPGFKVYQSRLLQSGVQEYLFQAA